MMQTRLDFGVSSNKTEKQIKTDKKTDPQKNTVFNDQTSSVFEEMQQVLEIKKKFNEERKKWKQKQNRK